ncbi:hypothetical protein [Tenacibaculum caenipelagi]|uniref:Uncharacterized protein n=1 Tax=Tenacibaculum caenipelagi TaxID=1325435 RepID=A0A4R6THQ7_9FLAO|nr:hypothetical protein [Tenacibaculum caenipelagi]TDQ25727.1 hypothetical protein DFQ07_2157 [Tenacibaculum caenipelagi]
MKIKQKIIRLSDIDSSDNLQIQICNKLKLKGWQFDKLTIEEKILKWTNRNKDKVLIIEIYLIPILKKIKESQSRNILTSRASIPEGYEMGNQLNRWVHNDPIIRTQKQVVENEKKIKIKSEKEYRKIENILDSINKKCQIEVIKKMTINNV